MVPGIIEFPREGLPRRPRSIEQLGISEEALANAFKQAQGEMRAEAFNQALAKAVEKGRLTEEEANKIKEWWAQRPAALGQGQFPPMFGAPGMRGGHMRGGHMKGGPWVSDNWSGYR